eukprot:11549480-Prorocentrum_lima.AAC.1
MLDQDCGESDKESQTSTSASSTIPPASTPAGALLRLKPANPTDLKSIAEIEKIESVYYAFVGELDP